MICTRRRFLEDGCETVPAYAILTDDPMRAKMLVAHHLENAALVSEQRGMVGYLGTYGGVPVGVFSVGYGQASVLAYLSELVPCGARRVLYLGECVSASESLALRDVVLAVSAGGARGTVSADAALLHQAALAASRLDIATHCLPVVTDDLTAPGAWAPSGQTIDFATHALFWYAHQEDISALSILTVSEHLMFQQSIEPAERQSRFHAAARLAFETVAGENVKGG